MSELRFHPFFKTWVITATHRQDRTFLPPADYNPLAPTQPGGFPTEIPYPSYDIVVFQNKFPSLKPIPEVPSLAGTETIPVRPSAGVCEVICYSENSSESFAQMSLTQVRKLARVWQHRYRELATHEDIKYVLIFENKGREIGVTLNHPHGQIYGYSYIPAIPATEIAAEEEFFAAHQIPLMAKVLEEVDSTKVWENELFVAFIPKFARYPYETYIAPKIQIASLDQMNARTLDLLAEAMLVVARKLDGLFGFSMPYIMAMHQSPVRTQPESAWFHVEFYPPYRTAEKLKYLAGSEAAGGAYINDTLPEVTSETLRKVEITPLAE